MEQVCHAGASVLITPAGCPEKGECFAVLSTCIFARGGSAQATEEVRLRAKKLNLPPAQLVKAFHELPRLDDRQVQQAMVLMEVAGESVRLVRAQMMAESRPPPAERPITQAEVRAAITRDLQRSLPEARCGEVQAVVPAARGGRPMVVEVIANTVSRRPSMPYSVADIAAAARISPNHFSTLFHKHMGQSFSDFLSDRRIETAKEILGDLTLRVSEVARKVGYDDPGYFARRFRQKTGLTPREWRSRRA
jgi:AraC-like DNA-binding protein